MLGRSKASLCQSSLGSQCNTHTHTHNYNSVTGKLSNSTFHHLLPSWCFDILKKSSSLFFALPVIFLFVKYSHKDVLHSY